jgi:hypothetical protein
MSALNFIGKTDRKEQSLILSQLQEQEMLKDLLRGRDDELYEKLYGTRYVRDTTQPATRGVTGNNVVMPFWN